MLRTDKTTAIPTEENSSARDTDNESSSPEGLKKRKHGTEDELENLRKELEAQAEINVLIDNHLKAQDQKIEKLEEFISQQSITNFSLTGRIKTLEGLIHKRKEEIAQRYQQIQDAVLEIKKMVREFVQPLAQTMASHENSNNERFQDIENKINQLLLITQHTFSGNNSSTDVERFILSEQEKEGYNQNNLFSPSYSTETAFTPTNIPGPSGPD